MKKITVVDLSTHQRGRVYFRYFCLVALVLSSLAISPLIGGCAVSPQATPEVSEPTTLPEQEATVVHILGVQGFSGSGASPGIRAHYGSQLAVDEINAAGGFQDDCGNWYTLELSKEDMDDDRAEAVALFRQGAGNPEVLFQAGPTTSLGYVPVVPVAEQLGMAVISNGSVAKLEEWNTWAYRVNSVNENTVPVALRAVKEEIDFERVALITDQTNDGQVAGAEVVRRLASEIGYEITSDTVFRPTDQDFTAQVADMEAGNPDLIVIMSAAVAGGKVSLQIAEAGLTVPQLTPDGGCLDFTWWDNSNGTVEGCYTTIGPDLKGASGELEEFIAKWTDLYPEYEPNVYPLWGYDTIYVAVEAIKKACSGTDRQKFMEALTTLETTTPIGGTYKYQNPPDGNNLQPVVTVIRVTGRGEYETIRATE